MNKIVERFKLKDVTIEIVATTTAYDVIYHIEHETGYFIKSEPMAVAYAFVAGFMYNRVKAMGGGDE